MRIVTEFGGNIPWIICACVMLYRLKTGIYLVTPQVIATIIVQPLKHLFHHPRPLTVFAETGVPLPAVDGVHLHAWNSFPSGHTAAIFALMVAVAMMLPKWWQKTLCILFAIIVGYSRIYLSQHFIDDVLFGAIIGIIACIANPFNKFINGKEKN